MHVAFDAAKWQLAPRLGSTRLGQPRARQQTADSSKKLSCCLLLPAQVHQEVQLHQQLSDSPVSWAVVPFWAAADDANALHIVMQHCAQGDLRSMLGSGALSEGCVRDQVVTPLLHALQELHAKVGQPSRWPASVPPEQLGLRAVMWGPVGSPHTKAYTPHTAVSLPPVFLGLQGYVHRDLKPDNVFMSSSSALLGDFSLAVGPLPGSSDAGSLPATPGCAGPYSRCSNDSTTSLTPSSSDSLQDSDTAAGSSAADCESEVGSMASLSTSRSSSLLVRNFTAGAAAAAAADGRCHAGGTPAYCAPEVVLAAFNSLPLAEALGTHVSVARAHRGTTGCTKADRHLREGGQAMDRHMAGGQAALQAALGYKNTLCVVADMRCCCMC